MCVSFVCVWVLGGGGGGRGGMRKLWGKEGEGGGLQIHLREGVGDVCSSVPA